NAPCSRLRASCRRGFTIIETIVAIAILSVALVAPLTLAQRGLNSSMYAKDQVTAFYLAQEAIEYVHFIRDSNNIAGLSKTSGWLNGLTDCMGSNQCGVDINAPSGQNVFNCTGNLPACQLKFNSVTGVYGHRTGWANTIFTRTLTITQVRIGNGPSADPNAQANLEARVSWKAGAITRTVVIKEKIFNWYPAQF
ncbi:MAG: prepilin-type N-terminal cleavage/methylation domain-containing protein, partial [Patescibacteria group bacterium]